jgi:glycosyltransferase involved in cell wall biosynthesis
MLVSGFTVLRNAMLMNYPFVESIRSGLPLVDEYIVAVGQSDDNTREEIAAIGDPKIKIIDTHWNTSSTQGGFILSEKTNEALALCRGDWCLYLQADELLHESDIAKIRECMMRHKDNPSIEGLLFKYLHFYGSFDTIATSRKWYRSEVRIVRNNRNIQSVGDAKGFRINGRKLDVADTGATVYHYGWVKSPTQMGEKCRLFYRWWHGQKHERSFDSFSFKRIYGLKKFSASHPKEIAERTEKQNWVFKRNRTLSDISFGDIRLAISAAIEKATGKLIFEKTPYRRLIRP